MLHCMPPPAVGAATAEKRGAGESHPLATAPVGAAPVWACRTGTRT